jgi:hypothetical protein
MARSLTASGAAAIQTETVTRFTRKQIIQTALLVALGLTANPQMTTSLTLKSRKLKKAKPFTHGL